MRYLIEQREDDRLAFTLQDTGFDPESQNSNLKAMWAGIVHSPDPRRSLREKYAAAYEERFYGSELHSCLSAMGESWEIDTSDCLNFGPLTLRFNNAGMAALFKLQWA